MNEDEIRKISKELGKLPILNKLEKERDEYLKSNEVGFYTTDTKIKFISTKRHILNYDWELSFEEITGIAFGNVFVFDDDFFIIFLRGDKKPIYFNRPGYASEEWQGYDQFMEQLRLKIGFEPIEWRHDTTIIAYPKKLKGKKLYQSWNDSIKAFLHTIGKKIGINHEMSGIIKDEFKKELKLTK